MFRSVRVRTTPTLPGRPGIALAVILISALSFWALSGFASAAEDGAASADSPESAGEATAEAQPASQVFDALDPATPVGAVRSFIDRARDGDYEGAAELLNMNRAPREGRDTEGPRLARWLKVVLDRRLWVEYERLSDQPEGFLDDGLPPELESVGTLADSQIDVLLERIEDAEGRRVWRFAAGTVARIPSLYEEYGYGAIGEWLPAPLIEIELLEMRLWQWIGMGLLLVAAWVLGWIVARILSWIARPLVARTATELDDRILGLVRSPLVLAFSLVVFVLGSLALRLSAPAYAFLGRLEKGAALVVLTWLAFRAVDVISELIGERMEREERKAAMAAIPLGRRAAKVFLLLVAFIGVLQNLGFNVTGLIAGLGVGGLAFALAAQKSIENLFGGVTLIADQPVRVGDFCRFGDGKIGTVEEIGLRSTRVRTLDRTVVSVPNSRFSEVDLENFAVRDRIRLVTVLGLRYETTPDQLRYVLAELRRVLIAHPKVSNDPARVRFAAFGAHSLDLEVFAFVETTDFSEFCKVREDLFLRFMDVVAESGSGFAFPSQTLYLGRDTGLDSEKSGQAEERVAAWRRDGDLPFPDFSEQTVEELNGTTAWPPEGSESEVP